MKDLVIGCYDNYNYSVLAPWVNSIKSSGFTGDVVLIVLNSSIETVERLVDKGVYILGFNKNEKEGKYEYKGQLPVHVERFFHVYNFLYDVSYRYKNVITTDVKDVVFQTNPSDWLDVNLHKKLIVSTECLKYEDEPWGNENLFQAFGPFFHERYKKKKINNVGVIAGESTYVRDFCLNIFLMSLNKPIQIVDQAVFNMLCYSQPYQDVLQLSDVKDGWAAHLGTVMDPAKIKKFKPFLTEKPPIWEDGVLKTNDGNTICIMHQYDRVLNISEEIKKKYGG